MLKLPSNLPKVIRTPEIEAVKLGGESAHHSIEKITSPSARVLSIAKFDY